VTPAISGTPQKPDDGILVAEIGSLSLEFTRLSQLTGDAKFFDAVQRISDRFEQAQSKTKLPGMWPVLVYPQQADFGGDGGFTLGAMAVSVYEYLPKVRIAIFCTFTYSNMCSNICYLVDYLSSTAPCMRKPLTRQREFCSTDQ